MTKLNLKAVKITAWICVCYCVLELCYYLYGIFFREWGSPIDHNTTILIWKVDLIGITLVISFVLVFVARILRGIAKHKQVFIPNNHRWLIYATVFLFIQPFVENYVRAYLKMKYSVIQELNCFWIDIILNPILHPKMITYIISGLMLLIVAYLYKIGAQAVEEQRLTI